MSKKERGCNFLSTSFTKLDVMVKKLKLHQKSQQLIALITAALHVLNVLSFMFKCLKYLHISTSQAGAFTVCTITNLSRQQQLVGRSQVIKYQPTLKIFYLPARKISDPSLGKQQSLLSLPQTPSSLEPYNFALNFYLTIQTQSFLE